MVFVRNMKHIIAHVYFGAKYQTLVVAVVVVIVVAGLVVFAAVIVVVVLVVFVVVIVVGFPLEASAQRD